MRRDDTSWCLTNQALGLSDIVGAGEKKLVLSLLACPSRSMATLAGTEAARRLARYSIQIQQDNMAFLSATNKLLELRNSNPDV